MCWLAFLREEAAQDVVEYALLLAFVVVCSAALLYSGQESVTAIWHITENNLESAKSVAQ